MFHGNVSQPRLGAQLLPPPHAADRPIREQRDAVGGAVVDDTVQDAGIGPQVQLDLY